MVGQTIAFRRLPVSQATKNDGLRHKAALLKRRVYCDALH